MCSNQRASHEQKFSGNLNRILPRDAKFWRTCRRAPAQEKIERPRSNAGARSSAIDSLQLPTAHCGTALELFGDDFPPPLSPGELCANAISTTCAIARC